LPIGNDSNVLAGNAISGGAGIYRLDDEQALVMTLAVLTPIVDDPFAYGRIAAANALSSLFATGARPLCAVALAAFPEDLDASIVASIFRGGAETCAQAGIPVVGGHTIKDAEPKYGFSVTGIVHPERIVRSDAGRDGDVLILTKALGVGILTTARHDDAIGDDELEPAIESMIELNAASSEAALRHGAAALSVVDDDGLIGRVRQMLGGRLGARIDGGTVPLFPRALALAAHDVVPSAARANLRAARATGARFSPDLPLGLSAILCDAQFSGGLVIAVPAARAGALLAELQEFAPASRAIGSLTAKHGIEIVWRPAKQ
jgi:selenide,water dikinase